MSDSKERGSSAYNTPYDELPDYFAIISPYTWLWLLEILCLMIGGGMLVIIFTGAYLSFKPEFYMLGIVAITIFISAGNAMLALGYSKGILVIQALCGIYIISAIPNLFLSKPVMSLFPILFGLLALYITMTDKFRIYILHRVKMGEWKRDQLRKNKIRREVIRERKAEARAKRKKN